MILTFYHNRCQRRHWGSELTKRPLCLILVIYLLAIIFLYFFCPALLFHDGESGELQLSLKENKTSRLQGRVIDITQKDDRYLVLLKDVRWLGDFTEYPGEKTQAVTEESAGERILGIRCRFSEEPSFEAGDLITLRGKLTAFSQATVPGQFDAAFYYKLRGYGYQLSDPLTETVKREQTVDSFLKKTLWRVRKSFGERLEEAFEGRDQGVFSAILLGDKTALDEELKELWQTAGIVHMLVISGLHLTLAAGFVKWLLDHMGLSVYVSSPLSFLLLLGYGALTGFAVSTIRALVMYGYLAGAGVLGRKADKWTALSLAALLILTGNPALLFDAGFQLSFGAVFFLTAFGDAGGFRTAVILQLGLLPLILFYYYELPLFSLILNFLLVPLLPVLLMSGILGMAGGFLTLPGEWLIKVIEALLKALRGGTPLTLITGKPHPLMMLLYWALLIAGIQAGKRHQSGTGEDKGRKKSLVKRYGILLLIPVIILLLMPAYYPKDSSLEISFLDVGQGDAVLIRTPSGENCLIDGGSSSDQKVGVHRLIPCLKARGIRCLDYLVATHLDSDHISGIYEILEAAGENRLAVRIKNLILPLTVSEEESRELCQLASSANAVVHYAGAGDRIIFNSGEKDETRLSFLSPEADKTYVSSNAGCLVAELTLKSFDCLLTGDLEGDGEEELTAGLLERKEAGSLPDYEILKVAHHGSRNSSSEAFLKLVSADAYVISCGLNNRYQHPHPELLERLEEAGGIILKTSEMGTITVKTDGVTWHLTAGGAS